jgi:epoxyqueuosine reductase
MREETEGPLLAALKQAGYPARIMSVQHLANLEQAISELHRQRLLSDVIYREYRTCFQPFVPPSLSNAKSIVVVAVPQPRLRVTFQHGDHPYEVIVPPTYDTSVDSVVQKAINQVIEPLGFRSQQALLPEKLLAVCSGLAEYGRNNVTYVPGLGSFYRLVAFFTDAPLQYSNWREPAMLEQCRACFACVDACPTGAISKDRFIIRAERCLTYYNEHPEPLPEWIDPAWHNSLIGCMRCQDICPVDAPFRDWVQDAGTFTETETAMLLEGVVANNLPEATRNRLAGFWLIDDAALVGRNLRLLMRSQAG